MYRDLTKVFHLAFRRSTSIPSINSKCSSLSYNYRETSACAF